MNVNEIENIVWRFDISDDEAKRIAETVEHEDEFVKVWENTDWWTDENNANKGREIKTETSRPSNHHGSNPRRSK